MTGLNQHRNGNVEGEPIYGVVPSTTANDPKILGSYLAPNDVSHADERRNSHLIMAVGNGDMWVVDDGADIDTGDYLISSSVVGHAMKDRGEFDVSYIVARAAEPIAWAEVTEVIDGVRHRKISVFFESFVRNHAQERTRAELDALKLQVEGLTQILRQLVDERTQPEDPQIAALK